MFEFVAIFGYGLIMHLVQIIAQNRINEAIERGEFADLPGKGKPLNLDEYFNTPEADRAAHSFLKNADVVPPEVELLKEIERLEATVKGYRDVTQEGRLRLELQAKRASFEILMEQWRRRG